jgi:tetratricopeptide (TPR) repeat protein
MGTSARIDELRKKFEENPRRYFAPLANEYRKSGDLEQAIFICQEYLPQQPGHMSGHIVYGQALYESGRAEEAKAVFETALSLDPENLIALRHLGDIARSSGDPVGARGWYQRVLDADPRNEEIVQLLAAVDSSPSEAPPVPVAAAPDRLRSTPLAIAAIEPVDGSEGSVRAPVTDEPEIEKSQEALTGGFDFGDRGDDESRLDELGDFDMPPLPPSHPAPAAATTSDDDLLDLDDFSIGGIAAQESAAPEFVEEAGPIGLDGDVTISGGFTLGTEDGEFESDSVAPAAPAPSPDIDLAADINLGLTDDSVPPTATDAEPVALAGLETFEAGIIAGAPDDVPVLQTEGFFDLPLAEMPAPKPFVEMSTSEAVAEPSISESVAEASTVGEPDTVSVDFDGFDAPVSTGEAEAPDVAATTDELPIAETAPEPAEAFVTETMAELYIQQGHLDSALDIYRKLVEQRPEEPELHERLRALEDRIFGAPATADADAAQSPPPSYGGPTIREFLMGLVSRTPAGNARRPLEQVDDFSDDVEPPRRESRMTPGASETITGSIDALFSGADASASDIAAADALAAAFAETAPDAVTPESAPLEGTPAHRAQDELSLDHVFKAATPPRESGGASGFSFDQFFADEMADRAEESSADASPGSPEATDDIAQFNAWLNGLKKT